MWRLAAQECEPRPSGRCSGRRHLTCRSGDTAACSASFSPYWAWSCQAAIGHAQDSSVAGSGPAQTAPQPTASLGRPGGKQLHKACRGNGSGGPRAKRPPSSQGRLRPPSSVSTGELKFLFFPNQLLFAVPVKRSSRFSGRSPCLDRCRARSCLPLSVGI